MQSDSRVTWLAVLLRAAQFCERHGGPLLVTVDQQHVMPLAGQRNCKIHSKSGFTYAAFYISNCKDHQTRFLDTV